MSTCNCPQNNCTCGCQSTDPCSVSSSNVACSSGEPCAQSESSCDDATQSDCCTNCNLFVETTQAFNMPACDGTGSVFVDDASRLYPGAVIYAEGVGFLTVVAVVDASEVTVRNDCPECSLQISDPGNPIPSGTQFGVGIPFCASEGSVEFLGTRLNSDYFIPNVGACILIAVTSIEGFAIGDTISIGSNRYRINDIPTTTSMEICNDGEGGSPGTLVEKDPDGDGVLDYPILRINSVNPCTADPVDQGKLLVCYAGSQQRRLEGTINNQVPTWDETEDDFILKVFNNLAICVTLVCCLTLDPEAENCSDYIIEVLPNTDDFDTALTPLLPNPLKISIDGDPFCVTEVIDSTHLRVVPAFIVESLTEYDDGAVVCIDECCTQCTPDILTMDNSFGGYGCEPEILVSTGSVAVSAASGIQTDTFPASLAAGGLTGTEEGADSLWQLDIANDECCDCRKYVEVTSNFEIGVVLLDPDHFVNAEFRILKTAPSANSQAFAGMPFVSPRGLISPLTPDLMPAFQTINTFKGTAYDRAFIDPGETVTFKGHIRLVSENNSGGPLDYTVFANWRVWVKVWNFDCASVMVTYPP